MNAPRRPAVLPAVLLAVGALVAPVRGDDRADLLAALERGQTLAVGGKYAEAAVHYERVLALAPKGSVNAVGLRALLADCYQQTGEYAWAESLYKQALAGSEAQPAGKDHPLTAETLMNLASLYRELGRYAEAEPLYRRALDIFEAKLGKDHPHTAAVLDRLAILYDDLGQPANAEPLYHRSLAIKEASLGKDHPYTAQTLNILAVHYKIVGQPARAEPLYQRSLAIREAKLGKDHPDTARVVNNLALLYDDLGQYARAEPHYRRALAASEARFGKDHPDTAQTLGNLANLLANLGEHTQAELLYRRSLQIREAKLGKDHPETARTLYNLALLLSKMGKWEAAAGGRDRNRRAARHYVSNTLPILSDREQGQFLKAQDESAFHAALSHGLVRRDHPAEAALSAGWVLNGKAVAGQVRAEGVLLARESRDPRTGPVAAELAATRQALAALALRPSADGTAAARQVADLAAREQDLARRLAQLTAARPPPPGPSWPTSARRSPRRGCSSRSPGSTARNSTGSLARSFRSAMATPPGSSRRPATSGSSTWGTRARSTRR